MTKSINIEVDFVKPFVLATLNMLKVQCSTEAKPGKPYFKGDQAEPQLDIAGVIGITSEKLSGTIAVCFPETTFLSLMSAMLGEEFNAITKELEDGAGEFMNIIYGQAKVVLNEGGYALQKALPTVIRGKNMSLRHMTRRKIVVLPFETNKGSFLVEVALDISNGDKKTGA